MSIPAMINIWSLPCLATSPPHPSGGPAEHMGVPKPAAHVAAAFKMSPTSSWVPLPITYGKAVGGLGVLWSSLGSLHQPRGKGQG